MNTTQDLWQKVLATLEVDLDPITLSTWFRHTHLYETTENRVIIACKDTYSRNIIQKKYESKIKTIIHQITAQKMTLEFIVKPERIQAPITGPLFDFPPEHNSSENSPPLIHSGSGGSSGLVQSGYTLDNFVVGLNNRVVHAAALSVVENPGQIYNPLFIYGTTGVGKTHMLHAIGNAILQKNPQAKVIYAPTEKFVNDLIEHIRQRKDMQSFRQKYRSCNALLIDDIQFLSQKDASQEEFYHTFNQLQQTGSQIVLASDREPSQIEALADRLVSRFRGGLMVMISPPDYETRLAIITTKAHEIGLGLSEPIADFIAQQEMQSIREINGLLLQIKSVAAAQSHPINLALVRSIINPSNQSAPRQRRITPEIILDLVTKNFDTSIKDLCGKRRSREVVIPRQMTMFLLRNELGMNLQEIGAILGGRDHTTVIHGVDRIQEQIEDGNHALLQSQLTLIRQELYS